MQENGLEDIIKNDVWGAVQEVLNFVLLNIGSEQEPIVFTVGLLITLILAILIASAVLKGVRVLLTRNMPSEDRMKFISVFRFIRYFIYIVILMVILSTAGIDIMVLLTASAALFVGLGLALREIFQDLIGGILIIIDKSLHVGDIIEVEGKVGRVIEINLRTTRAVTRDDKIIVIPNHKFIKDVVYNYTQNHKNTREVVEVRTALDADVNQVKKILLESAEEQKGILKSPAPFILLDNFGESSFVFGVYFFINDSFVDPKIKSELRFRIQEKFGKHGVRLHIPKQDIQIYENNKS